MGAASDGANRESVLSSTTLEMFSGRPSVIDSANPRSDYGRTAEKLCTNPGEILMANANDKTFLMSITRHSLSPLLDPLWHKPYQRLIAILREPPTAFNLKACYEATRVIEHYGNFTRGIEKLQFEKASKVIDFIFDNHIPLITLMLRKQVSPKSHYAVFHGLREFIEMDDAGLGLALQQLPGAFQLWRKSNSIPGSYVKGAIFIEADLNGNVLKVEMLQRFIPEVQIPDNPVNSRREILSGYIFRQSDGRYIMALRQVGRQHLRVTFLTEVAHQQDADDCVGPVDWMQGKVIGIDNSKPMVTGVYMERVSNNTKATGDERITHLLNTLNVYGEHQVPENIKRKLGPDPLENF
jgi:hypothetical protein